jgi:hypothetical protein
MQEPCSVEARHFLNFVEHNHMYAGCVTQAKFSDVIFPPFRGNPPISSILEEIKPFGFDLK